MYGLLPTVTFLASHYLFYAYVPLAVVFYADARIRNMGYAEQSRPMLKLPKHM